MSANPSPPNPKAPASPEQTLPEVAPAKTEALPVTEALAEEAPTLRIQKPASTKPAPSPKGEPVLEEEASTVKIQKPKPSLPAVKAPPPTEAAPKTEASSAAAQAAPTEAPPPAESPKPLQKLAIVIDDEPANRDFLTRLIAQASYTTKGAASGKEAISLTEELDGAPMVIVIDSELPDTSGMELLRRFRPLYPQTKIIMATMHDNPSLIHEAFAAGCNAFVVKPHGFMDLFKRLQVLPGDMSVLEKIVFDRYGVREFKGSK